MAKTLSAYTDAGARGNPGPAAIAVLLFEGDTLVKKHGEYIGEARNNQAEYRAIIRALELAKELGAEELNIFTDSELVSRQLRGEYKVKDKALQALYARAKALEKTLRKVSYESVPRESFRTRLADRLVNRVLDSRKGGSAPGGCP